MAGTLGRMMFMAIIALLAMWVAWMAADTEPPYTYDVTQSHIVPDPAPQGSMVTADWAISKVTRKCPGTSQRYFRDMATGKIVATLDTTPMSRAVKPGDTRLPRSFELPPKLPAVVGYSTEICAECNVLQKIFPLCFMTPEIVFRVIQ